MKWNELKPVLGVQDRLYYEDRFKELKCKDLDGIAIDQSP